MHNSKVCFKCSTHLPLSEFYKHKMMGDGHLNKCKECTKKDTKENIANNIEYYREYDKSRGMLPHRVDARKAYSQTGAGKESHRKSKEKWLSENVIKRSAHLIVQNAVKRGDIIKPDICEACTNEHDRIHGHHDNYDYPLSVRWLCPKCHSKWHRENGSGLSSV